MISFNPASRRGFSIAIICAVCRVWRRVQGDIVSLLDAAGTLVVEYKYDAWGKPISTTGDLSSTLGTLNPFRYRGYVYDQETQLYYLQSRYYNPEWGRFISSDTLVALLYEICSTNIFCYCYNNPISNTDYSGFAAFSQIPPASSAGYVPPKGGAVKVHSDYGYGWKDKKGNIWVPSSDGHGGDHWDVHRSDGRGYINVYPDGYRRAGAGKEPNIPPAEPQPNSSPAPEPTPSPQEDISLYVPTPIIDESYESIPDSKTHKASIPGWVLDVAVISLLGVVTYFAGPYVAIAIGSTLVPA